MTEYEMASLLQGFVNIIGALVMNYFSLVTAYLVAGYLVAHRLTLSMTVLVTTIFALSSVYFISNAFGACRNVGKLAGEMRAFAESGKGLAWHNAAAFPPSTFDALTYTTMAIMVAGFVAAVYFFFHCRRQNLKATP